MSPPTPSDATLLLRLRRSRRKAVDAAAAEVAALLRPVGGHVLRGGPLSEVPGVAWVGFTEDAVTDVAQRLDRLGYSESVELVRRTDDVKEAGRRYQQVHWKGKDVVLVPVYREADEELREEAPDRRSFLLQCGDGVVRRITGYRGGRGDLERRALPVVDARLLVNLVACPAHGRLLDPFAGAGGVLVQARAVGWKTLSIDFDATLRFGLAELSDLHSVGDARALPFRSGSVDAVATEPPYHKRALSLVATSVAEIARVLRPGGRAAMLAGAAQADTVRKAGELAGLAEEFDTPINRKGTDVHCFCWRRSCPRGD